MPKTYLALCFDLSRQEVRDEKVWLPLIPAGVFSGLDGRTWNNSNPDAIVAAFTRKRPFDVEHATHILGPKGKPAPAYGWIEALENIDGEVWGMVEWNEDGQRVLGAKSYAFYSPSFTYDANGVVKRITSAALTNDPNLDQLPALNREETPMLLPVELTQALGLGADADTASALTAINTLKADHQLAMNRANAGPDLTKFVPKETHEMALNRAQTSEAKLAEYQERELSALVDDAIKAGKVAPANREMYLGLCRSDSGRQQFVAFIESAPVIASSDPAKGGKPDKPQLEEHELAMCRKLGIKQDEYLAARQAMNKQGE